MFNTQCIKPGILKQTLSQTKTEQQISKRYKTNLERELVTVEVRFLFLPEIIGFNDINTINFGRKMLLQNFQDRLDIIPCRSSHVNNNSEAELQNFFTKRTIYVWFSIVH